MGQTSRQRIEMMESKSHALFSAHEDELPTLEEALTNSPRGRIHARIVDFHTKVKAPLEKKGTANDLLMIIGLLSNLANSSLTKHEDLHEFITTFKKTNQAASLAIKERPYREEILLPIAELHRRIYLINLIVHNEEQNRERGNTRAILFKRFQEIERENLEIILSLESKWRLYSEKDNQHGEIKKLTPFFSKKLIEESKRAQTKWEEFNALFAQHPTDEKQLRDSIENLKDSLRGCQLRLESYKKDSKTEITRERLLPPLDSRFKETMSVVTQLETNIDVFAQALEKLNKQMPREVPLPELLTQAFDYGADEKITDPFPLLKIKAAIQAQKSYLAQWSVRASEPEWEVLEKFTDQIYQEWQEMVEGIPGKDTLKTRIEAIKNAQAQYNHYCGIGEKKGIIQQRITALEHQKTTILKNHKTYCEDINNKIYAAFNEFKEQAQWNATIQFCKDKLTQLEQIDIPSVIKKNRAQKSTDSPMVEIKREAIATNLLDIKTLLNQFEKNADLEIKNLIETQKTLAEKFTFTHYKKLTMAIASAKKLNDIKTKYVLKQGPVILQDTKPLDVAILNVVQDEKERAQLKEHYFEKKQHLQDTIKIVEEFEQKNIKQIQQILYTSIWKLLQSFFTDTNLQYLNSLVTIYSSSTINHTQVPEGFKRIHDQIRTTENIDFTAINQIVAIAREKQRQQGCFNLFRKHATTAAYSLLTNLGSTIDKIHEEKFTDAIQQIEHFKQHIGAIHNESRRLEIPEEILNSPKVQPKKNSPTLARRS